MHIKMCYFLYTPSQMLASPVQPNVNKNTPASLAFLGLPEPSWTFWASLGLPGPSWAFLGFPGTWTVRRKTHYVSVVVLVVVVVVVVVSLLKDYVKYNLNV